MKPLCLLLSIPLLAQVMAPILNSTNQRPSTSAIVGDWDMGQCTVGTPISSITDAAATPHNLSASTTARPTCISAAANGHNVARFDGIANVLTSTSFTQAQPYSIFLVAQRILRQTSGGCTMFSGGASSRLDNQPAIATPIHNGNTWLLAPYGGSAFSPANPGGGLYGASSYSFANNVPAGTAEFLSSPRPVLIEVTWNGASSTVRVNSNTIQTGSPGASGISGGITVGAFNTSNLLCTLDVARVIITNSTLSAGNKALLEKYLISTYGISSAKNITFDGDSLSNGYLLATQSPSHPALFFSANPTYSGEAPGINGQECATISTNFSAWHSLDASPLNARNLYWLWCGTNDIAASISAATLETTVQTIATAAHAAGLKIGFMDIIARGDLTGPQETERQTFNTWARANPGTWDAFVDLGSNANIGCTSSPATCYNNATYFNADKVHLTATGQSLVESLEVSAILGL